MNQQKIKMASVRVSAYQFLMVDLILGALSVLGVHAKLRNSLHLYSTHCQRKESPIYYR